MPPTWPRAVCCRCWGTGPTCAVRTGRTGSPAGSAAPAATRTWCSARSSIPPRTSRSGWPTPGWPARRSTPTATAWLDYFDRLQIEAVGLGWLVLHQSRTRPARVRHRGLALPPRATDRAGAGGRARRRRSRAGAHRSAAARPPLVAGRRRGGGDHRSPRGRPTRSTVIFRQQRGFRRAVPLDTATAGILGACDGELTLGQIIESVAQLLSRRGRRTGRRRQSPGSARCSWTASSASDPDEECIPKAEIVRWNRY